MRRFGFQLAFVLALFCWALVGIAAAQQLEARTGRAPYYVGVPIEIEVHSEGFEREPEPTCAAEQPTGGKITLVGISPNISSSFQIINGRISRSQSVKFTCHFRLVADRAGRFAVGPFSMTQTGNQVRTQQYQMEVQEVPLDGRMKLRVRVPSEPVYLGQRVRVGIEWWLSGGLEERIHSYAIRSPLFDMVDRVRFTEDVLAQRGEQALQLDTAEGEIRLKARTERREEGGESYLVLSAERTLIPLRAGEYALGSAHVQVEEITRYSRDLFGRRTAAGTTRLLARDLARKLVVKPPPASGRPASFAGAVGRGFSFDVSADRSVVQVGDPISLTLTVSGDGNLATIGLPQLGEELSGEYFRLPDGDLFGHVDGESKTFEVSVRVLDESVREIPALSYSWFDPEQRSYQSTQSRPIALSVRRAQIVAAGDVVSGTPARKGDGESADPARASASADSGVREFARDFTLEGADLSVEGDLSQLRSAARLGWPVRASAYGLSVALLAGAFLVRRRNEIDPEVLRRNALLASAYKRINAAAGLSGREATAQIAGALRELMAGIPETRSEAAERFVQRCDDALYAPDSTGVADAGPDLQTTAVELLRAMSEAAR